MKINEKKLNTLIAALVVTCGLIMGLAMFFDKTNIILTFGFMLNAMLIAWSKK